MRRGAQADLLSAWGDRRFLLVTSPFLLNEVEGVLSQARLRKKYRLQEHHIEQTVSLLRIDSLQVSGTVRRRVCRDPDDNAILACAVEGAARYLITGDHDLLILGQHGGIRILTARHYLERLHLG